MSVCLGYSGPGEQGETVRLSGGSVMGEGLWGGLWFVVRSVGISIKANCYGFLIWRVT